MFKRLMIVTAMAASVFCISDAAEAQFGGVQVQVGGYGSGIRVGTYGYGSGLYSGYGYNGFGYGNQYSNFYGRGYGYGGPSLNYQGVYGNNANYFGGYPAMNYRVNAARYYASPVRRYARRYR